MENQPPRFPSIAFPALPVRPAPVTPENVGTVIEDALPEPTVQEVEDAPVEKQYFLGKSPQTRALLRSIDRTIRSKNIPYLEGMPGVGKTAIIEAIAKSRGMYLFPLIGSTMDPSDVGGMPHINDNGRFPVTEYAPNGWLKRVVEYAEEHPEGSIIFIDEVTTLEGPLRATTLSLLQSRRLGEVILPDNVAFIIAGNPAEYAVNGSPLEAPLANRLKHIVFEPSIVDWFEGMRVSFNRGDLTENERAIRQFIVAYLSQNHAEINRMPENAANYDGAWPSMRSWDNACRELGCIEKDVDYEEDIPSHLDETEKQSRRSAFADAEMTEVLRSYVGADAATQFSFWKNNLNIPSYNEIIANPNSVPWNTLRPDEVYVMVDTVIGNLNPTNWDVTLGVFGAAVENGSRHHDIIGSSLPGLTARMKSQFERSETEDAFKQKRRQIVLLGARTTQTLQENWNRAQLSR